MYERVVFTNINFPGNAGDHNCSPFQYYKFPFPVRLAHFPLIEQAIKGEGWEHFLFKNEIIVIGGGGLITHKGNHLQETLRYLVENNKVILWGIGSNTPLEIDWDILNHENVLLAGIRDKIHGIKAEYLPCVSAKHSLFDKTHSEPQGLGLLEHHDHPIDIKGDRISNSETIENIVNFISSKESIITSSYHGVYWAQLLNKKVLYYPGPNKLNSKFLNLKHGINVCDEENYKKLLETSSHSVGLLKESRYLNDEFYTKVVNIVQNLMK